MTRIQMMLAMVLATWATDTYADHGTCFPELELRRKVISVDGNDGIWFNLPIAKCMLKDLHELRATEAKLKAYEKHMDWTRLYAEAARYSVESLQQSLAKREEQLSRALAWYRSPILWFALGALIATVGGVLIGAYL